MPAACGDVSERAVAVVAKQLIGPEARDVEIDPAVVVEVAGRRTHSVAGRNDAARLRHIGETQRPRAICVDGQVVAKEPAP